MTTQTRQNLSKGGGMTKEQFWQKFNELKHNAYYDIGDRAVHLLNSGVIDLELAEDNYLLPKIVLCSCLEEAAFQFRPIGEEGQRELAYLRRF